MKILRARFRNGEEFLRNYQPALPTGGLFFPTREALEVGAPLVVEVRFPALRDRMMLRGLVAWRRPGRHRTKLRAGVAIEFADSEIDKRDFLLAVARGDRTDMVVRRHRRLPVDLDVAWRVASDRTWIRSRIEDIGAGGAFVSTSELRPPGTEIVLDVVPPGSLVPLSIAGRVAWVRQDRGVGVEFRWRDAGGARRLRELVRRLERGELRAAN
jgi:Tfp pilus assembly protein PilZ